MKTVLSLGHSIPVASFIRYFCTYFDIYPIYMYRKVELPLGNGTLITAF